MSDKVDSILARMTPITLPQMKDIHLMDRLDFKFVAPVSLLPDLLEGMESDFMVQEVNDKRISPYATQYFDTPDMGFFVMHQNGKLNRQKIRIRSYLDSNISFLEVKNKNNKGRTKKHRTSFDSQRVDSVEGLNEKKNFLVDHSVFDVNSLVPTLENSFRRITLVNNKKTERITIDTNLSFSNFKTHRKKDLDPFMILELKQDGWIHSHFRDVVSSLNIKQSSFSKYCIGIVLTDSEAKYNRFKKKLIILDKLLNQ
jgi:hypothetical protein